MAAPHPARSDTRNAESEKCEAELRVQPDIPYPASRISLFAFRISHPALPMNRRTFARAALSGAGLTLLSGYRPWPGRAPELRVNGDRLNAQLRALSEFGKNP